MSAILDRCRLTGNVVFDADYRTGSVVDRSPYAAAATVTQPVNWVKTRLGNAVRFNASGLISYADNAANRLAGSDATWIILGTIQNNNARQRLISKRGLTSGEDKTSYDFFINIDNEIRFSAADCKTTVQLPTSMLAVSFVSGNVPKCFSNGSLTGTFNNVAFTIASSTTPIYIGNIYSGTSSGASILNRVTILNRALSAPEISQLYTELMSEQYPLRAYSFGSRISAPIDPPGVPALLKTDFTTKLPDGRLADLSGNGWHGTIQPGFVAGPGMSGNSLVANSATRSYVDFGDILTINGATKLTTIWYGKRGTSNAIEAIYSKSATVNTKLSSYFTTTTFQNDAYFSASDSNVNVPLFRADVYDGTQVLASRGQIYSDNNKLTTTVTASCPTSLPNNTGVNLKVGSLGYATANQPSDKYEFFAIYNYALTDSQVGFIYKQIARRKTFTLDMQRVPITLANITGPSEVPNTPFRVAAGTWKISEDTNYKHWFETVSTNNTSVYMPSTQAYGTWVFDIYNSTNDGYVDFISNKTSRTDTACNIYTIGLSGTTFNFKNYAPSNVITTLMSSTNSVVANTSYRIAVSRISTGSFTFYIKGGIYGRWTQLTATTGTNPIIDTSYTTSNYFMYSCSTAGLSKFSNIYMYQGVLTISDLIELGL